LISFSVATTKKTIEKTRYKCKKVHIAFLSPIFSITANTTFEVHKNQVQMWKGSYCFLIPHLFYYCQPNFWGKSKFPFIFLDFPSHNFTLSFLIRYLKILLVASKNCQLCTVQVPGIRWFTAKNILDTFQLCKVQVPSRMFHTTAAWGRRTSSCLTDFLSYVITASSGLDESKIVEGKLCAEWKRKVCRVKLYSHFFRYLNLSVAHNKCTERITTQGERFMWKLLWKIFYQW